MHKYFHIILDLDSFEQQNQLMKVISSLNLQNVCINFNPLPTYGYYRPVKANLLVFCKEKIISLEHYQKKHRRISGNINFICIGECFYFHRHLAILEIPRKNYSKYLQRCLLNLYLEHNKIPEHSPPHNSC